jgi:hypothetical protein
MISEAHKRPRAMLQEVRDAEWSDYGRMVADRLHDPELVTVIVNAGLKSKTGPEMANRIRVFLLTGAKP